MIKLINSFIILSLFFIIIINPKNVYANRSFTEINLSSVANLKLADDYVNFPTGLVYFNNVPFYIDPYKNNFFASHNIACPSCPRNIELIDLHIDSPINLWILVNSSDSFLPYNNKDFANINLKFDKLPDYNYTFKLGYNVREWLQSNNYGQTVNSVISEDSVEVWSGFRPNGEYPVIADLLKIPLPETYKGAQLQSIKITDASENNISSLDPGIIIKGITVENTVANVLNLSLQSKLSEENFQLPSNRSEVIKVNVKQNSEPVKGVKVFAKLDDEMKGQFNQTSTITVEDGNANFVFTPKYNGPVKLTFYIEDGTEDSIDLNVYQPPVLIVPGAAASFNPIKFFVSDSFQNGWNWAPTAEKGWEDVISMLESQGLTRGENFDIAFYDWRKSIKFDADTNTQGEAISQSLQPKIASLLSQRPPGQKVDILAHSFGGLVSRALIQNSNNQDDVSQLITIGTPHMGSSNTYYLWEGATNPPIGDAWFKVLLWTLGTLQSNPLTTWNGSITSFRNTYPGLLDLMPIYDKYLARNNFFSIPTANMNFQNTTLSKVMNIEDFKQKIESKNIKFTSIYSTGENSMRNIETKEQPFWYDRWEDGVPLTYYPTTEGDGAVLEESAKIDGLDSIKLTGEHANLPNLAKGEIQSLLGLNSDGIVRHKLPKNLFMMMILSPAYPELVDSSGKVVSEKIDWKGAKGKLALATDLDDGIYTVKVIGTDTGKYDFKAAFSSTENWGEFSFNGKTKKDQIDYFDFLVDQDNPKIIGSLIKTKMIVLGSLIDLLKGKLVLRFALDIPKGLNTNTLNLNKVWLNGTAVETLETEKRANFLIVSVPMKKTGPILSWNEKKLKIELLIKGDENSLLGDNIFNIPWGLYKKQLDKEN